MSNHPTKCKNSSSDSGFSIVELLVALFVLAILCTATLGFYASMVQSTFIAKRKAVASSLATNQMEYLKSLPYNSLAVAGGSIVATSPLPAYFTTTVNNILYTVRTNINYADDSFDGCGSYPTLALKQEYCMNYPAPSGAPATDTNPADYKSVHVSVYVGNSVKIAEVDTKVSARVAETASNTGALFAKVIDSSGNPLVGANVAVSNTTLSPNVSVSDSTDSNGVAVFYGLPPDTTGYDYVITATLANYSSLTTIAPSGALQPNYSSVQILVQQSSSVTLTLKPQAVYSLVGEVVNTSGAAIANAKIHIKGGYKKYTSATDTTYYYDTMSPSDTRPTTDSGGVFTVSNLVPGGYYFCGDSGATSCSVGGTTYYLAAAVPYAGISTLSPVTIPTYTASNPPSPMFTVGSNSYVQKVRLILTTSSSYPRLTTITPAQASTGTSNLSSFAFVLTGANLPCNAVAASCATTVRLLQGSNTYTASCTGAAAGITLNCTVNISTITTGDTQLVVIAGGNTLTLPATPLIGGLVITP